MTFKKACRYIYAHYLIRIDLISLMDVKLHREKYSKMLDDALGGNAECVFLWRSSFGWNVPLFQRPQHISRALARQNALVFYEVTALTDKVRAFSRVEDNLYLVNFNNKGARNLLLEKLAQTEKPKYLQFYAPDCTISLEELTTYIKNGYKILYEYIDQLSPKLIGTKTLPKNLTDKYDYMITHPDEVFVVVTADVLAQDVISKRGNKNICFACNGVDVPHFSIPGGDVSSDYKSVCQKGKTIIGYYGALATWFDYDLLKLCAKTYPDWIFVLLGIKYDGSFDEAHLEEYNNIIFFGSRPYADLPAYSSMFTVCTIPFLINDITKATNPVKVFEYMATGRPIVTTAMDECKKYKSVMIADSHDEYLKLLAKAVEMTPDNDPDYYKLLKKEAAENDWSRKAQAILELMMSSEDQK